ncbi:MAG: ABC transporter permease [Chthonomonadales bacterium]|nr:ABC transporter permease [Chthonomonadales bacterium]
MRPTLGHAAAPLGSAHGAIVGSRGRSVPIDQVRAPPGGNLVCGATVCYTAQQTGAPSAAGRARHWGPPTWRACRLSARSTHLSRTAAAALRPWLSLAVVCAGFSLHPVFRGTFWTADYLPNILQQAATNIILAVGMTFVILTGGIDLSVGSVLALCGVALGLTVTQGPPPFLTYAMALPIGVGAAAALRRVAPRTLEERARISWIGGVATALAAGALLSRGLAGGVRLEWAILAALAVGLSVGILNGLVTTCGGVPPFVTTLGTLTAARGLTVYATGGTSVSGLPPRLGALGEGAPLVAIAFAVVIAGIVLRTRTRAGRYIVAIGGNEEAARLTGVAVARYTTLAYALSGLAAAIAAVVLTAKFRLADTGAGTNAELNAIAAVVIGGTSLSGGQGTVIGSLVGALTIAVLNAGLVLVGVQDTLQGVVIGAVIIVTVMVDRARRAPGAR